LNFPQRRGTKENMTASLTSLSLAQARDGLLKKNFSAQELTQAYLDAMGRGACLNAYITPTPEDATRQAAESDKRLEAGTARPLEGLPLALKDLFCTPGVRTTAGSRMLEHFVPAYGSTVTHKLKEAGALSLGKTNMDEFAMGSANITSFFGPTKNPWRGKEDLDLVPGGSSGGSAAVVSGGLAVAALGTDTGGSIRQPAAFCGIVGLKPTYGRCSRRGTIAFASSLDTPGPLTRTVEDAALVLHAISGHDPWDATSSQKPVPFFPQALGRSIKGLKVGIPREYQIEGMAEEIVALWAQGSKWLEDAGAILVPISLPHTSYALPVYYVVAPAEASSNMARYDGVRYGLREGAGSLDELYENTRDQGFGAEVKRRLLMGTYVLSHTYHDAYYIQAQRVRRLILNDFLAAFREVDVILTPSAPSHAFPIGAPPQDPVTMYLNDVFTVPASLGGLPAISVPAALSTHNLPLGLQLIGRGFDEETVLNVAQVLEKASSFPRLPFI